MSSHPWPASSESFYEPDSHAHAVLAAIGKVIVERFTGRRMTDEEANARAKAFLADPPRQTHLANKAELEAIRNRGDEPTAPNRTDGE